MKVLVIEDEQKIARAISTGLKQEHMNVEIAEDGPTGYSMAMGDDYDVIILDRMLPGGKDGLEICKDLRKQKLSTPIIMLSAKSQTKDKVAGLNAGADDYMVKPFAFEELLARVRALTRRPKEMPRTCITVGPLTLNMNTYQAERSGKHIRLSRTEYALLAYLMRNAGRVMSKDQIISHVWDFDSTVLPNTVEAYVKYLRDKVDRAFPKERPLIETARGFGYIIHTDESRPR